MRAIHSAPRLDRIGFRPGDRLAANDLQQASGRLFDLLRLHQARVHGVWGVAAGLSCSLTRAGRVTVQPGLAIDSLGRPLVLAEELSIPGPQAPGEWMSVAYDLIASWSPARELVPREGDRPERPSLRWVLAGHPPAGPGRIGYGPTVRPGPDVPLARLTVPASLPPSLSMAGRPITHGLVRPKIVSGTVAQASARVQGQARFWSLSVDTTAAGFVSVSPLYLVSFGAHPFGEMAYYVQPQDNGLPAANVRLRTWRGPFISVQYAGRTGFQILVTSFIADPKQALVEVSTNPVPISWIGIETSGQQAPLSVVIDAITRSGLPSLLFTREQP